MLSPASHPGLRLVVILNECEGSSHGSFCLVTPASAPSYIHNEIKISMDVQVTSVADSS